MTANVIQLRNERALNGAIMDYVNALGSSNLLDPEMVRERIKPVYERVIELAEFNGLDPVIIQDECMTTFLQEKKKQQTATVLSAGLEENIIRGIQFTYEPQPPTHPAKKAV
jgi:hypothetical protein